MSDQPPTQPPSQPQPLPQGQPTPQAQPPPQPQYAPQYPQQYAPVAQDSRYIGWLNAVKGLTLTNVIVIAVLLVVAVPTYAVYRALNDEKLLDRLLSEYEETYNAEAGCTVRHGRARGGMDRWGIMAGFASSG